MATSGVDTIARTAREVIKRAFVLINVVAATQDVSAVDEAFAVDVLNDMMQGFTTKGVTPWRKQSATFTPVAGQAEYNISQRPLEVITLRWQQVGGTEIPLDEMTHDEYFDLPNRLTEGTPSQYHVQRNRTDTSIFLWPVPSAPITTQIVNLTYNRRTQIIQPANVATEEIDVPQEWLDAIIYNLAARLSDSYGGNGPIVDRIISRAQIMLDELMMYEREGDQAFYPDEAYA